MADAPLAACTPNRSERLSCVLTGLVVGLYTLAVLTQTALLSAAWAAPLAALLGGAVASTRLTQLVRRGYWTVWSDRLVVGLSTAEAERVGLDDPPVSNEASVVPFASVTAVFAGIPVAPRVTPAVWFLGATGRLRALMQQRSRALVLRLASGDLVVFSPTRPDQEGVWAALAERLAHLQVPPDAITPAESAALAGRDVINRTVRVP